MSVKKNQLQVRIDGVKAQYANLLTKMQELQTKLAEGQKRMQKLSEDYMKAVNQNPPSTELNETAAEPEQIPMAVESFVHSLGISLTEEQKSQLHELLKRPNQDPRHPRQDTVGNIHPNDCNQGWTIPVPDEDDRTWDDSEGLMGQILGKLRTEHHQPGQHNHHQNGFAVLDQAQMISESTQMTQVLGNKHMFQMR